MVEAERERFEASLTPADWQQRAEAVERERQAAAVAAAPPPASSPMRCPSPQSPGTRRAEYPRAGRHAVLPTADYMANKAKRKPNFTFAARQVR